MKSLFLYYAKLTEPLSQGIPSGTIVITRLFSGLVLKRVGLYWGNLSGFDISQDLEARKLMVFTLV